MGCESSLLAVRALYLARSWWQQKSLEKGLSGMEVHWKQSVARLVKDKQAATAVEYGLIVGLIAVVIVGGLAIMGETAGNTFNNVANTLDN